MQEIISIVEVGPRDGLQNEKVFVPTPLKIDFINALLAAGLSAVEVTSFVPAKWVPQMADHEQLIQSLDLTGAANLSVLIPNQHGYQRARELAVSNMAFFTAASTLFCQKNTACDIQQSMQRVALLLEQAKHDGVHNRVYVSCVYDCPYQGAVDPVVVVDMVKQLYADGAAQISLGDTTGRAYPEQTAELLQLLTNEVPVDILAVHFHNTENRALDNIQVALDYGVRTIDSSAAGLGGCPYSPGASGNVSTESVVRLLHALGYATGVDLALLQQASLPIINFLQQHSN